jgi:nitroreductase
VKDNSKGNADFYEVIKSRRSVRYYDPSFEIPREEIIELVKEATLAPSGHNAQGWRFLIVDNQDLKKKLLPITFGQNQVVEASAVIVVLADKNAYSESNIAHIYDKAIEAGYMSEDIKNKMLQGLEHLNSMVTEQFLRDVMVTDCGLVSMQILLAAKARGYDTVPMMGYDAGELRKVFNVPDHLISLLIIPIGKAAKPGHPTIRLNPDEVVFWNSVS